MLVCTMIYVPLFSGHGQNTDTGNVPTIRVPIFLAFIHNHMSIVYCNPKLGTYMDVDDSHFYQFSCFGCTMAREFEFRAVNQTF